MLAPPGCEYGRASVSGSVLTGADDGYATAGMSQSLFLPGDGSFARNAILQCRPPRCDPTAVFVETQKIS